MNQPDWSQLKGGAKHMWLENNRDYVLAYYRIYGEIETRRHFNLGADTLQRFLGAEAKPERDSRFDRLEMLVEMCNESCRESRLELRDLRRQYLRFSEVVSEQIVNKFIVRLVRAIQLPSDLETQEGDGDLSLREILKKGGEDG